MLAVRLPVGALAGYGLGYSAFRPPGRLGETIANIFFFAALAAAHVAPILVVFTVLLLAYR